MTLIPRPLPFLRPAVLLTALVVCCLFPCTGFGAKAPDQAAGAIAAPSRFPVSDFQYRGGKDPFFPNRSPRPAPPPDSVKKEVLVFKGVTGNSDRRVALINDRPFTKGETGEIKLGTNTYPIRVIDIKDRSVTIERAGQTNELPLIENLLPLDGGK